MPAASAAQVQITAPTRYSKQVSVGPVLCAAADAAAVVTATLTVPETMLGCST